LPNEHVFFRVSVASGSIGNGRQAVLRRYVCNDFIHDGPPQMGCELTPIFHS
jgi:hypothetical protein